MSIAVLGAGAFGTALSIALTRGDTDEVILWSRDPAITEASRVSRRMPRLPKACLPKAVELTSDIGRACGADIILLAMPAQTLADFLSQTKELFSAKPLIACCKGIDVASGLGPVGTIRRALPEATAAILTGPSFAADIAVGLPTALTLACEDADHGRRLQSRLSTPVLRIYTTTDTIGAELGGALKNVMAIACGACIGAGFGHSARAALMTRGFAEMQRLALHLGAEADTLSGLSGFGDLVLTCTSEGSRNFQFGLALGRGDGFDPGATVEGVATSRAVSDLAQKHGLDLPISTVVANMVAGRLSVQDAMRTLLSRPLKEE